MTPMKSKRGKKGRGRDSATDIDVLAIGTHPDDVEVACGGLLLLSKRRGYRTGIVDLTEGEMGTRGTVELRSREVAKATKLLRLDVRKNLCLPDSFLELRKGYSLKLAEVFRELRPRIILAPYWEDRHPDHMVASRLVHDAWWLGGLQKVGLSGKAYRADRILYYMGHWEFDPTFVVDIGSVWEAKMKVIRCYDSQFFSKKIKQKTYVSTRQYTDNFETRARHFGHLIGTQYGEAYLLREKLPLPDPVGHFL